MNDFWADRTASNSPTPNGLDFGGSDTGDFSLSAGNSFDMDLDFSPVPPSVGTGFQSPLNHTSTPNLLNFHNTPAFHNHTAGMRQVAQVSCDHQPQCHTKDQHIAILDAYIKSLEAALGSKNAKLSDYRWLRERFDKLVEAYQELSKARTVDAAGPATKTVPALPRPLRKDHPKVLYWKRSDWTTSAAASKVNVATIRGSEGKRVHKVLPFLQDAAGNVTDWDRLSAMRASLRAYWAYLASKGEAPTRWGEIQFGPQQEIRVGMYGLYEELTLCDDDWKLHWLCTEGYSSWYSNRKDELLAIKQEADTDDAGLVHDDNTGDNASKTATTSKKRGLSVGEARAPAPPAKRLQKAQASLQAARAPQGDPDGGEAPAQTSGPPAAHAVSPATGPLPSAVPSAPHDTSQTAAVSTKTALEGATPALGEAPQPAGPSSTMALPEHVDVIDAAADMANGSMQQAPTSAAQSSQAGQRANDPGQSAESNKQTPIIRNPLSKFVGPPIERDSAQARVPTRLELVNKMSQQIQSDPASVPGLLPAVTKKKTGQSAKAIDRSAKVVKPRSNVLAPDLLCKLEWWESHQDDTEGDWQDYWDALPEEEVQKWHARSAEKRAAKKKVA